MARYIRVDVHTYYPAEECSFYNVIADDLSYEEIERWACEVADEYAEEMYVWADYESQGYDTDYEWEEAYFSNCGYRWEELTKEEYDYEVG